jgi:hypothetical protein
MPWFPILLATHIALAISLLLPSILLPFLLRRRGAQPVGGLTRALMAVQGSGTLVLGAGLALTGAALIAILGMQLLRQPWLLVALVLYAANLLVAGLISRPNLRRLVGIRAQDDATAWERRARLQRWIAYAMATATGVIGFLMMAKPGA